MTNLSQKKKTKLTNQSKTQYTKEQKIKMKLIMIFAFFFNQKDICILK